MVDYFLSNFNFSLVALSYGVSVAGSFMALLFVRQALQKKTTRERLWVLSLADFALGGIGIWSMHFIGMLAYGNQNLQYDLLLTVESFAIAVIVVFAGFCLVSLGRIRYSKLLGAGILVGMGVVAMHYSGMAAVAGKLSYDPLLVKISVAIAVVAATVALWLTLNVAKFWQMLVSAVAMGIAVCGMHYTGMAAVSITPAYVRGIAFLDNLTLACVIVLIDICFLLLMGFIGWVLQDQIRHELRMATA
jgi:NO-binding membrane sensor protein with MHYT domain